MKKIIEYRACVELNSSHRLTETVNYYITQGWQPFGGISVCEDNYNIKYCQGIVKYEE